jgi:hypothetical protein
MGRIGFFQLGFQMSKVSIATRLVKSGAALDLNGAGRLLLHQRIFSRRPAQGCATGPT